MANFEMSEVEFRSDGLSDSLTLTMSPAIFHESLKREISNAERENRDLVLISISLLAEPFDSVSRYEKALIEIAFGLPSQLRGGDFFVRISDHGFWVLLRSSEVDAQVVLKRLDLPHAEHLETYVLARNHDQYSEWIKRIDPIHFS